MKRRRTLLGNSEPLPGFITQHPSPNTATYDGQEHELCTAGSGSGTMLYSINGVSFSSSIPTKINAGTYTVYYKTDATPLRTESRVYQISCTIDKADGSVLIVPTDKSVTYNGTAQDIVNAGSGTGTMYYRIGSSGDFSTTIPKQTNANSSYTILYYSAESSNYTQSSTGSITATIGQREVTLAWGTASWTYDKTAHSTTCTAGNLISGDSCTVNLTGNSITNVGSTTVTASSLSNSNYKLPSANTKSISVGARTVILTWGTVTWTYDKSAHSTTCTAENLCSGDTCTVTLTGNSITNKGTTTVTASSLSNSNYALPSSNTATLTINAREVTLTWGTVTWTYDGQTHSTTCTAGNLCSGDSCTVTLTGNSVGANAGTATVTASSLSNSNYTLPSSKTATLTINKAAGSVSTAPTAKNPGYTGSAQELVNAGAGTGTMYYRVGTSGSFTANIPTATNAGSYTIYYYAAASTNYNLSSTGSVTSTISYVEGFAPSTYSISVSFSKSGVPSSGGTTLTNVILEPRTVVYYYSKTSSINTYLKSSTPTFISGVDVLGGKLHIGNSNVYLNYQGESAGSLYKLTNGYRTFVLTTDDASVIQKGTGVYRATFYSQVNNNHTWSLDITVTVT